MLADAIALGERKIVDKGAGCSLDRRRARSGIQAQTRACEMVSAILHRNFEGERRKLRLDRCTGGEVRARSQAPAWDRTSPKLRFAASCPASHARIPFFRNGIPLTSSSKLRAREEGKRSFQDVRPQAELGTEGTQP